MTGDNRLNLPMWVQQWMQDMQQSVDRLNSNIETLIEKIEPISIKNVVEAVMTHEIKSTKFFDTCECCEKQTEMVPGKNFCYECSAQCNEDICIINGVKQENILDE